MKKLSDPSCRHPLCERVRKLILDHRLFAEDDIVIVAVSGGPDSLALLHILARLDLHSGLVAIYIDHGLRPAETGTEIKMIGEVCTGLQIPFATHAVDVGGHRRRTGSSLEEAARTLRYAALESARIRHGAAVIAVAHTADDQAEEVLLRLIRGCGREGLSGMALKRDTIVRPLLHERKISLLTYLNENNLSFCRDSSNQSRTFLRNRVRLDLLPFLEQNFNPAIRTNLLQTAEILRHEEDLLRDLSQQAYGRLVRISEDAAGDERPSPAPLSIALPAFIDTHPALQRRVLEKVFWRMGTAPGFRQIEQVRNLIINGSTGAEIHLGAGLRVWKTSAAAVFSHPDGRRGYRGSGVRPAVISLAVEEPGVFNVAGHRLSVRLLGQRPTELAGGELLLDADRIAFPLLLRNPLPQEKFTPLGASGRRKITRFLSDVKISRWKRDCFPVLVMAERIIAVAGQRIDNDFRVRDDTRRFLVVGWQELTPSCA